MISSKPEDSYGASNPAAAEQQKRSRSTNPVASQKAAKPVHLDSARTKPEINLTNQKAKKDAAEVPFLDQYRREMANLEHENKLLKEQNKMLMDHVLNLST